MNKVIGFFIILSIILLPFDSVPGIFPSVYRPISLIFLILVFPLVVTLKIIKRNNKVKKTNLLLLIFFMVTIASSFVYSYFKYNNLNGFIDYSVTLTLGVISYFSFDYYLSLKRLEFQSNEKYIFWIFEIIGKVYILILAYGVYEIFVMLGVFPQGLKQFVINYLTGRGAARIQLTSGETSWATMHIIFILPIYYYLMNESRKYKKYFYIALIILLLMFSLQGYLIVICGIVIYLLLEKKIKNLLSYLLYTILLCVGIYLAWIVSSQIFEGIYYITRIEKLFNIQKFSDVLYLDGSVFVRVVFPYIGLLIFENNLLLGIGGGNFRFELGNFISSQFPMGLQYAEVSNAIYSAEGNPKNMFSRLLAETGLLGSALFGLFLYRIYKMIEIGSDKVSSIVKIFIVFVIAMYIQFDSFAYIQMWLAYAIANNLTKDETTAKKR